jgi:2-isopropylmalate synthase
VSHFVDEIANLIPRSSQAYVGRSAFAHKGGLHVDAMSKNPTTYEHIAPDLVGNETRMLVSELSGAGTIAQKLQAQHPELTKESPVTRDIYDTVIRKEGEGYLLEAAEASFELLVRKATGAYRRLFNLLGYRVIVEHRPGLGLITEATLKLSVDGQVAHTVGEGDGPVHALDTALRSALQRFYPELSCIKLTDYKVRVVNDKDGAAAKVRVLINSADDHGSWATVGVSTNIIEASWEALSDALEFGLSRKQ